MKIYKNSIDNSSRYVLGELGVNNLICFGINPSIADSNIDDPTIKQVRKISYKFGYDGWIMLNIYPQRSTDPNNIDLNIDKEKVNENNKYIEDIFMGNNKMIWAAWGNLISVRKYLINALRDIVDISLKNDMNWITIGNKTIKGNPHHPLYLPNNMQIRKFEIEEYIRNYR